MGIDQAAAVDPTRLGRDDWTRFWREPRFDHLECLTARFRSHAYAPHCHDTYAIGVITDGAEAFRHGGSEWIAGTGQIAAVNPDELHDGRPAGRGFAYRMLYPSIEVVGRVLDEVAECPGTTFRFARPVLDDPELAAALVALHRDLEDHSHPLASDCAMLRCVAALALRHGDLGRTPRRLGREHGPIRHAREYLDAHYAEDVDLATLAALARLSRFHLIRAFRRELGTTPHAYLMDRRVACAKTLLAGGLALSETALACGFYDQSHFTRAFKARTGVTPGHYRRGSNFVQDQ